MTSTVNCPHCSANLSRFGHYNLRKTRSTIVARRKQPASLDGWPDTARFDLSCRHSQVLVTQTCNCARCSAVNPTNPFPTFPSYRQQCSSSLHLRELTSTLFLFNC